MTPVSELRQMGTEELETHLTDAKAELFNLRFQYATGQFDRTHRFKELRREIARVLTIISEQATADADETIEELEETERVSFRARLRARRKARADRLGEAEEVAAAHAGEGVEITVPEDERPGAQDSQSADAESGHDELAEEALVAPDEPEGDDVSDDDDDRTGPDEAEIDEDALAAEALGAADEPEGDVQADTNRDSTDVSGGDVSADDSDADDGERD